jgi:PAS domain S-box-containing protein
MVVEDEGLVAMQIKDALETLGYEVPAVAPSGEEAVGAVSSCEPDLVVMDIQLKGALNGIEAARRIRATLKVPIVYLTAYSDMETLEMADLTDPYGYVLKPFDEKNLHAVIQMALLKSRRLRASRNSEMWVSAIPSSMSDAVLICDTKGEVKFLNPAAEALLGLKQEQVFQKRLFEVLTLIDSVSREKAPVPVSEPLAEGRSVVKSFHLVTPGGAEVPVEFSASPLRSGEGTLFGILYVFRQTTERERVQTLVLNELEEMARLQKQILPPRNTVIGRFRFDWVYHGVAFGGGDTLGFFPLDEEHVAFYALQVIGQGMLSSLFSLVLRTFLSPEQEKGGILVNRRAKDPDRRILSPSEVVRQLTRRFYLSGESNPYFTLVYGILETATGSGRLVRAGYPPPLHLKNGGAREIKPEGYAIGLFPEADMKVESFRMDTGDRLAVASHGLLECTNPDGLPFASKRLAERMLASRSRGLEEAVDAVDAAVREWRAGDFEDDISLLALERL